MGTILVTGANGFVGKRLIYKLLEEGHTVYALVRSGRAKFIFSNHERIHLIVGDLANKESLPDFPTNLEAAYYFVHSMAETYENLKSVENHVAKNFLKAVEKTNCEQIIYLSGIVEDEAKLSPHLRARLEVEKLLQRGKIPCTVLRASIIIGAGRASFEIIRDLTEKLPVMVAPKWVKNECQPIWITDVLFYLTGVLLNKKAYGNTYDIGGPEVMSFRDVLLRYAAFRDLKRYIINIPLLTPRLSSYWLVFITSVKFSICSYLVESMKQNTRKLNTAIDALLPHKCARYEGALSYAFQKIAQNEVVSSWMDAWDLKTPLNGVDVPIEGCLRDIETVSIRTTLENVREKIWAIGGDRGWYSMNWAWKLRGFIDKLVGGAGFNRGRRHPTDLEMGDSVDFWRVILADKKNIHVILYAQMKMPGEAWLEFKVSDDGKFLIQTATFRPKGVLGYLYWYLLVPFHFIIFRHMAKSLS